LRDVYGAMETIETPHSQRVPKGLRFAVALK